MQRRRGRAEIEQMVAEFTGSSLTRTEFCRRHGMSLGTLNRYLNQRREQGDRTGRSWRRMVMSAAVWRWCYRVGARSKWEQDSTGPHGSGWLTC